MVNRTKSNVVSYHLLLSFLPRKALFYTISLVVTLSSPAYGIEIIAFGDSITAGTGSPVGGYPARLQKLIISHGKPCNIYDFGIPGEKTDAGAMRIDEVLDAIPADMILIMEGTNDVRKNYPWKVTQKNLQLIIDKAKAKGVLPVIATLTPSNRGRSEVLIPARWNPMIIELAHTNKIPDEDHYGAIAAQWKDLNLDGIHPNEAGHDAMAKIWDEAIEDMITKNGTLKKPLSGYLLLAAFLISLGVTSFSVATRMRNKKSIPKSIFS